MQRLRMLVVLAALAPVASSCGNADSLPRGVAGALVVDRCGAREEAVTVLGANHVEGPIDYPDPPPAGGDHSACWATWGVHTDTVPPERWVHNLEHGGVVYLYGCAADGCGSDAAALAEISAFVGAHPLALITPYTGMTKRFAVVSWGHRLVSDCIDARAATAFYSAHVNWGPESISSNPGPSCN